MPIIKLLVRNSAQEKNKLSDVPYMEVRLVQSSGKIWEKLNYFLGKSVRFKKNASLNASNSKQIMLVLWSVKKSRFSKTAYC